MKRTAFTMLELVFVMIVIGILAILAMPSFNRNPLAEATEQMANHIRYTQHLAMVDDRYDTTKPQWYSQMWVFRIRKVADVNNGNEDEWYYEVFSDRTNDNDSTEEEEATDPLSGQSLGNGSFNNTVDDDKIINMTRKYGIKDITYSGGTNIYGSTQTRLAFDNLGRPYRNAAPNLTDNWRNLLISTPVVITLTGPDDTKSFITITPETGYVSVTY